MISQKRTIQVITKFFNATNPKIIYIKKAYVGLIKNIMIIKILFNKYIQKSSK